MVGNIRFKNTFLNYFIQDRFYPNVNFWEKNYLTNIILHTLTRRLRGIIPYNIVGIRPYNIRTMQVLHTILQLNIEMPFPELVHGRTVVSIYWFEVFYKQYFLLNYYIFLFRFDQLNLLKLIWRVARAPIKWKHYCY